jgi:hypothetical protein
VDWRVKTFESEAVAAFDFLLSQGFIRNTEPSSAATRRPTHIVVKFVGPDVEVETALSLGFAGEDGIYTTVRTTDGSSELGPSVAHKGHEMRKALRAHAGQVRDLLERR